MAGAVYGAPAGIDLAQFDIQRQAASNLDLATGQVKLKQAQIALQSQERMMQYLSHMAGQNGQSGQDGSPGSMADEFYTLSQYAAQSGLTKEASEYARVGSTLEKNSASIEKMHFDRQLKEMNLFANLLDNVNDQASWNRANAAFMLETGQTTPWARMPYSPQLIQKLRDGVLSQKDRMTIASQRAKIKYDQSMERYHEHELELKKDSNRIAEERNKTREKNGGKQKDMTSEAMKQITNLIISDYGAGAGKTNIALYARPIAERAAEILKKNPSLQLSEAASQAYQEAKADGELGGMSPQPHNKGTRDNPLPMPQDLSTLQDNMYYRGKNGELGVWNAQIGKFVLP